MENRIKKVMEAVFDESDINEESSILTVKDWDSLKHMNLIIALEDEFEVSIPDKEVGNLISFEQIKTIIGEVLQNAD